MPEYDAIELEQELAELVKDELVKDGLPEHPASDVSEALAVADILEAGGYAFRLKDMCPKSLCDSMWKAVFTKNGAEFSAEAPEAGLAVCAAAVAALRGRLQ